MTIEQATDVAGMDAIDQLLSSGLVVQSQNKKGMPVIQDDFELRAAIRIEFARRARLWRLIVSYARSDRYVVQNCSTAPEMARLLKGYRGVSRPGACSVCADDGRKVYPIGELPPIPHMNCTCDDGCQCIVIPILVSGRGLQ
ncbi:MAG: hypothetical protein KDA90_21995 [Planctomycetaceae bacterium]|nr:hypothetical protein [Planctomycetaceae bacterium]